MEKFLRPERFDATPNASGSGKAWVHWKRTFTSFLTSVSASHDAIDKFEVLINFVSPAVFEYISDCNNYDNAMQTLEALFVSPKNEIFARHILATRLQQSGETLVEYINVLKLLAKDCHFKPVTAEIYRQELIRDAFINGIQSQHIQQRLLENITLTLEAAFTQARSLELAQKTSDSYNTAPILLNAAQLEDKNETVINAMPKAKCFFCGGNRHNRQKCPAKDSICHNCGRTGHFAKVCQSKKQLTSAAIYPTLASIPSSTKYPCCLQKTILQIQIDDHSVHA